MKTAEEIFEEMKVVFENESGYPITDGCDMAVRLFAAAAQTESLYIYADWVLRQCFPQTAEGTYLDSHAASRGLVRKEGKRAEGELVFFVNTAAVNDILVPAGTVCQNYEGTGFETLESAIIPEGETLCAARARAIDTGEKGNAPKRTINFMTNAPAGIEGCTNTSAFTGGENEENDEALRGRILEIFKTLPNGANSAWYKKKALEIEGVVSASVIPCARGVGTVDVVITSVDGVPTAELIERVQSLLNEEKELCVDVLVYGPETIHLNIEAAVKVKTGYDAEAVISDVKAALSDMFGGGILGRKVYCAEICDRIYHTAGVESYRLVSPDYDYTARENVLLRAGEIKVSRW